MPPKNWKTRRRRRVGGKQPDASRDGDLDTSTESVQNENQNQDQNIDRGTTAATRTAPGVSLVLPRTTRTAAAGNSTTLRTTRTAPSVSFVAPRSDHKSVAPVLSTPSNALPRTTRTAAVANSTALRSTNRTRTAPGVSLVLPRTTAAAATSNTLRTARTAPSATPLNTDLQAVTRLAPAVAGAAAAPKPRSEVEYARVEARTQNPTDFNVRLLQAVPELWEQAGKNCLPADATNEQVEKAILEQQCTPEQYAQVVEEMQHVMHYSVARDIERATNKASTRKASSGKADTTTTTTTTTTTASAAAAAATHRRQHQPRLTTEETLANIDSEYLRLLYQFNVTPVTEYHCNWIKEECMNLLFKLDELVDIAPGLKHRRKNLVECINELYEDMKKQAMKAARATAAATDTAAAVSSSVSNSKSDSTSSSSENTNNNIHGSTFDPFSSNSNIPSVVAAVKNATVARRPTDHPELEASCTWCASCGVLLLPSTRGSITRRFSRKGYKMWNTRDEQVVNTLGLVYEVIAKLQQGLVDDQLFKTSDGKVLGLYKDSVNGATGDFETCGSCFNAISRNKGPPALSLADGMLCLFPDLPVLTDAERIAVSFRRIYGFIHQMQLNRHLSSFTGQMVAFEQNTPSQFLEFMLPEKETVCGDATTTTTTDATTDATTAGTDAEATATATATAAAASATCARKACRTAWLTDLVKVRLVGTDKDLLQFRAKMGDILTMVSELTTKCENSDLPLPALSEVVSQHVRPTPIEFWPLVVRPHAVLAHLDYLANNASHPAYVCLKPQLQDPETRKRIVAELLAEGKEIRDTAELAVDASVQAAEENNTDVAGIRTGASFDSSLVTDRPQSEPSGVLVLQALALRKIHAYEAAAKKKFSKSLCTGHMNVHHLRGSAPLLEMGDDNYSGSQQQEHAPPPLPGVFANNDDLFNEMLKQNPSALFDVPALEDLHQPDDDTNHEEDDAPPPLDYTTYSTHDEADAPPPLEDGTYSAHDDAVGTLDEDSLWGFDQSDDDGDDDGDGSCPTMFDSEFFDDDPEADAFDEMRDEDLFPQEILDQNDAVGGANDVGVDVALAGIQNAVSTESALLEKATKAAANLASAVYDDGVYGTRASTSPINDYEADDFFATIFPWLFPLGVVGKKPGGSTWARKLLLHRSGRYACDHQFILFSANRRMRMTTSAAASRCIKVRHAHLTTFLEIIQSKNFVARVKAAIADPKTKDAQKLWHEVAPTIKVAGAGVAGTPEARNSALSELYSMTCLFGTPSYFVTVSPDDVSNELVLTIHREWREKHQHTSLADPDNASLDTDETQQQTTSTGCSTSNQNSNTAASDTTTPTASEKLIEIRTKIHSQRMFNAATSAGLGSAIFHELMTNFFALYTGLPSTSQRVAGKLFQCSSDFSRSHGIFNSNAWHVVYECQGKGTLHGHALFFGGLSPELLTRAARDDKDCSKLRAAAKTALESIVSAHFSKPYDQPPRANKFYAKADRRYDPENTCESWNPAPDFDVCRHMTEASYNAAHDHYQTLVAEKQKSTDEQEILNEDDETNDEHDEAVPATATGTATTAAATSTTSGTGTSSSRGRKSCALQRLFVPDEDSDSHEKSSSSPSITLEDCEYAASERDFTHNPFSVLELFDYCPCKSHTALREMVKIFQTHCHSKTCFKGNKSLCRMGIPCAAPTNTEPMELLRVVALDSVKKLLQGVSNLCVGDDDLAQQDEKVFHTKLRELYRSEAACTKSVKSGAMIEVNAIPVAEIEKRSRILTENEKSNRDALNGRLSDAKQQFNDDDLHKFFVDEDNADVGSTAGSEADAAAEAVFLDEMQSIFHDAVFSSKVSASVSSSTNDVTAVVDITDIEAIENHIVAQLHPCIGGVDDYGVPLDALRRPKPKSVAPSPLSQLNTIKVDDRVIIWNLQRGKNDYDIAPYCRAILEVFGCNCAVIPLGSNESAIAVSFYNANYMVKDGLKIEHALPVLVDAVTKSLRYRSSATDFAAQDRKDNFLLQISLNGIHGKVEIPVTMAALTLLGYNTHESSHKFAWIFPRQAMKFIDARWAPISSKTIGANKTTRSNTNNVSRAIFGNLSHDRDGLTDSDGDESDSSYEEDSDSDIEEESGSSDSSDVASTTDSPEAHPQQDQSLDELLRELQNDVSDVDAVPEPVQRLLALAKKAQEEKEKTNSETEYMDILLDNGKGEERSSTTSSNLLTSGSAASVSNPRSISDASYFSLGSDMDPRNAPGNIDGRSLFSAASTANGSTLSRGDSAQINAQQVDDTTEQPQQQRSATNTNAQLGATTVNAAPLDEQPISNKTGTSTFVVDPKSKQIHMHDLIRAYSQRGKLKDPVVVMGHTFPDLLQNMTLYEFVALIDYSKKRPEEKKKKQKKKKKNKKVVVNTEQEEEEQQDERDEQDDDDAMLSSDEDDDGDEEEDNPLAEALRKSPSPVNQNQNQNEAPVRQNENEEPQRLNATSSSSLNPRYQEYEADYPGFGRYVMNVRNFFCIPRIAGQIVSTLSLRSSDTQYDELARYLGSMFWSWSIHAPPAVRCWDDFVTEFNKLGSKEADGRELDPFQMSREVGIKRVIQTILTYSASQYTKLATRSYRMKFADSKYLRRLDFDRNVVGADQETIHKAAIESAVDAMRGKRRAKLASEDSSILNYIRLIRSGDERGEPHSRISLEEELLHEQLPRYPDRVDDRTKKLREACDNFTTDTEKTKLQLDFETLYELRDNFEKIQQEKECEGRSGNAPRQVVRQAQKQSAIFKTSELLHEKTRERFLNKAEVLQMAKKLGRDQHVIYCKLKQQLLDHHKHHSKKSSSLSSDLNVAREPENQNQNQNSVDDSFVRNSKLSCSTHEPIREVIVGGPGVGKSFLINTLSQTMRVETGTRPIICSYTGLAASHVKGQTVHRSFSMHVKDLDLATHNDLHRRVKAAPFILIDEVSMIGARFFAEIIHRIERILRDPITNEAGPIFGDAAFPPLILVGDFAQLPPVNDVALFTDATHYWETMVTAAEKSKEERDVSQAEQNATIAKNSAAASSASTTTADTKSKKVQKKKATTGAAINSWAVRHQGLKYFGAFGISAIRQQQRAKGCRIQEERVRKLVETGKMDNLLFNIEEADSLKRLDAKDAKSFRFAPIVTGRNKRRRTLNFHQATSWAACHGIPLVVWKKGIDNQRVTEEVLAGWEDPSSRFYEHFLPGATCCILKNVVPHLSISNGSSGVMHSLVWNNEEDSLRCRRLIAASAPGQIIEVTAPDFVNIAIKSTHILPLQEIDFDPETVYPMDKEEDIIIGEPQQQQQQQQQNQNQNQQQEVNNNQQEVTADGSSSSSSSSQAIASGNPTTEEELHTYLLPMPKWKERPIYKNGYLEMPSHETHFLELAFSFTFHKVQGTTLDKLVLDLNFESAMECTFNAVYVGISRVRSDADLRILPLTSLNNQSRLCNLSWTKALQEWMNNKVLPTCNDDDI